MALFGRDDRVAAVASKRDECRPLTRDGSGVEALAEIGRRARDSQIVIVNEAHDSPQGRAFIGEVASVLRPLGFTIYAAETFLPPVGRFKPDFPLATDGTYSNEPVFGNLLRHIRKLGYAMVPYEAKIAARKPGGDPIQEINWRETQQVQNLVDRIFAGDPHARVMIHVGYSHASELSDDGISWMALRLKQKLGIDPLTVDQTSFGATGDRYQVCGTKADGTALDASFDIVISPLRPGSTAGAQRGA